MKVKYKYNASVVDEKQKKKIRTYFKELEREGFTFPENTIEKITGNTRKEIREQFMRTEGALYYAYKTSGLEKSKSNDPNDRKLIPIKADAIADYYQVEKKYKKERNKEMKKALENGDDPNEIPKYELNAVGTSFRDEDQGIYALAKEFGDVETMERMIAAETLKVRTKVLNMKAGPKDYWERKHFSAMNRFETSLRNDVFYDDDDGAFVDWIMKHLRKMSRSDWKKFVDKVGDQLIVSIFKYKEDIKNSLLPFLAALGYNNTADFKKVKIGKYDLQYYYDKYADTGVDLLEDENDHTGESGKQPDEVIL